MQPYGAIIFCQLVTSCANQVILSLTELHEIHLGIRNSRERVLPQRKSGSILKHTLF